MAAATCEIAIGFRASAEPGTTNSQTCAIAVGFSVGTASAAWSGSDEPRNVSDWLPPMSQPVLDPRTNRFTRPWWNYFRVLGERLGGVQGASITQIESSIVETQQQVVANTAYVDSSVAYAQSVAATAEATAQVTQNNGLSGAESIPPTSNPPNRPSYQPE
jgi:membrane carboxypeptidase/penicillin-binding protein